MGFTKRLANAWNAFMNRDPTDKDVNLGGASSFRPDRYYFRRGNERSIITSIINRIGIDVASIHIVHARLDDQGRYLEPMDSGLNDCLSLSANLDQTGRACIQDMAMSLCDEGAIAVVPIDTDKNPHDGSYDILSWRVCKIVAWYPAHIKVDAYDERNGLHRQLVVPKENTAIIENPLNAIMNTPNSTLQRLIRKINMLDSIDEQVSSGKLNLIIQLPYLVKGDLRKQQAEQRRKELEMQLIQNKYGVAYIDGSEKITQLNRSIENNLLSQIEYLTGMLYSQLGITKEVMDGTASEAVMINYHNRTIEPILSAITDEMKRKFLTKTARSQGQSILFFREPFKLATIASVAELADRLTRNEILTSNEVRQILGFKPSTQPEADELRNKNLNKQLYPEEYYDDYDDGEYDYDYEDQSNTDEYDSTE